MEVNKDKNYSQAGLHWVFGGPISFQIFGYAYYFPRPSKNECPMLVGEITARVKTWGSSRNCSGRVTLINSVLLGITCFRAGLSFYPRRF